MKHRIEIHELGPIENCVCELNDFTVFTGPQSNGKSTIAKAIYFFRTIKQDIISIMQQGGPSVVTENKNAKWDHTLQQRLRNKFLELFGTSWVMSMNMTMMYTYRDNLWIRVYLKEDSINYDRNYVCFSFSEKFKDYLDDLDMQSFHDLTSSQLEKKEKSLVTLFDDPYETVFIPAGRNLITLLSTQLNYIFTSLESSQLRSIDYITKRYTELILRLKPLFKEGYDGIIFSVRDDPDQEKKYKKHRTAINMLLEREQAILNGSYRYVDGEERLYLDSNKYVKINFASSGQQEIVWVFNLLFYFLLEDKKVFLILEEPESHLFPDSQQGVGEILALFANEDNQILVTTHSPYILGTINYLLLAGQGRKDTEPKIKTKLHKRYWIHPEKMSAFFVSEGNMSSAVDDGEDIVLIKNELIDGASQRINEISDAIIDFTYSQGAGVEE